MRLYILTIAALLFPLLRVFAHEGETEITNLAEADWIGPLAAALIIVAAVILARIIRKRSKRQIINNNNQK